MKINEIEQRRQEAFKQSRDPQRVTLTQQNRELTLARIADHKIHPPFLATPFERAAGLQIIRKGCNELNRAYRVKRGVLRGGLILASVATYEERV